MFQFRRFPAYAYFIQRTLTEYCSAGFPHSEIPGSKPMCGSPRLIAACHVLLRLSMPRHSPCALISLTVLQICSRRSALVLTRIMQTSDSVHCSLCYPFIQKVHKFTLLPLCCLLAISCLHSLFSFQGAGLWPFFQDQIEMLGPSPKHFNLFLVEITGLEPVTPCLQSRCSTS